MKWWPFGQRGPSEDDVRAALHRLRRTDSSDLKQMVLEAQDGSGRSNDAFHTRVNADLATIREADPETIARIREDQAVATGTLEDFYWGRPVGGTEEDYLWRRLSDNWYQKDVIPSTYLEIHNQCFEAYNANPLAKRTIDLMTSMLMGRGLKVVAKKSVTQKVLDTFWKDSDNHMETRSLAICRELALYGEQFIRFFVNPINGAVKIGQIDPSTIDQIVTDPENVEKPIRFHQRPVGPGFDVWGPGAGVNPAGAIGRGDKSTGPAILPHGDLSTAGGPGLGAIDPSGSGAMMGYSSSNAIDTPTQGRWFSGIPEPGHENGPEIMQFCINKVSNAKRGTSDLACMLVWLRRYKDWLTDRVRINKYKGSFLWDVTLTGADKNTVDRKKQEYAYPPNPGSIVVHNESEKWEAVDPRIGADRVSDDGKQIKMMIAVGAGLPEHYLAEGGNVNKATAAEMTLPTQMKFEERQDFLAYVLRCILDRVIVEAQAAGTISQRVDTSYEIVFPPINLKDGLGISQSLYYLMPQLGVAVDRGWMSDEAAMKIIHRFLGGDAFDVSEEFAKPELAAKRKAQAKAAAARTATATANPNGNGKPQRTVKAVEAASNEPYIMGSLPSCAGLAVRAKDTGRVLMIQRSIQYPEDPARGTWEFPGGHLEPGETPIEGARREWTEETGVILPPGRITATWTAPGGIYRGIVYTIDRESMLSMNPDHDDRHVLNPDDPDGDDIETMAWWAPQDLPTMRALRPELRTMNWSLLGAAPRTVHPLESLTDLAGDSLAAETALLALSQS